jgi:fructose-1,6-bisphosphatase/sedoheptulose 1,7-bisphosphatase-like protein
VQIFDGPPTTELDPALALYVGLSDPDNQAAELAADFTQSWGGLGRQARNETSTIHCCAQAWAGTDDLKTVRVSATGIVAAVEVLMQSDSSQFGGNVLFPAPGLTTGSLLQNNTDRGAIARVAFDLIFQSRIGG